MRTEITAVNMEIEKMSPMVVVVEGKIKNKRYIGANIGYGVCQGYGSNHDGGMGRC
jgi:hypothetical protein